MYLDKKKQSEKVYIARINSIYVLNCLQVYDLYIAHGLQKTTIKMISDNMFYTSSNHLNVIGREYRGSGTQDD